MPQSILQCSALGGLSSVWASSCPLPCATPQPPSPAERAELLGCRVFSCLAHPALPGPVVVEYSRHLPFTDFHMPMCPSDIG